VSIFVSFFVGVFVGIALGVAGLFGFIDYGRKHWS
jgi:hypothetical protein